MKYSNMILFALLRCITNTSTVQRKHKVLAQLHRGKDPPLIATHKIPQLLTFVSILRWEGRCAVTVAQRPTTHSYTQDPAITHICKHSTLGWPLYCGRSPPLRFRWVEFLQPHPLANFPSAG
jgi:hypothetical protein